MSPLFKFTQGVSFIKPRRLLFLKIYQNGSLKALEFLTETGECFII